jgi:hypothetical protein
MNPDFPYHKTTDYITYVLTDDNGNTVSFKVRGNKVNFTDENGKTGTYLIGTARNFWNEYVRRGFNVANKCIHHDMKEFYKAHNEYEAEKPWAFKEFKKGCTKEFKKKMYKELASKDIHDTICKYERDYSNYALEA